MSVDVRVSRMQQVIAADLDSTLETIAGERVAFTLIVFTHPRASYVSSAARGDSVREIKRLLELWEQGMPDVPAHSVAAGEH